MLHDFKKIFSFVLLGHLISLGVIFEKSERDSLKYRNLGKSVTSLNVKLQTAPMPSSPTKRLNSVSVINSSQKKIEKKIVSSDLPQSVPNFSESFLSEGEKSLNKASFKQELRAEIEKNKFYPVISRRLGQSGVVEVAFTLMEDGHIINVRLNRPSPFDKLNESALNAVKKVHKFRPIPKEWGEDKMDILVSLKFITI